MELGREVCPLRWPPRVLGAAGARLPEGGLLVCSRSGYLGLGYQGFGYRDGDPPRAVWQPRLPLLVLKVLDAVISRV